MWGIYIYNLEGGKQYIRVFEYELDAADYCDSYDWQYTDEDGKLWQMDYEMV